MGWLETRIKACEERIEYLIRLIQDLIPQIRAAAQAARTASSSYGSGGGSGSTGGAYVAYYTGGGVGATASPPPASPTSGTGFSVYVLANGAYTLVSASATIYNPMPAAISASYRIVVTPVGDGTYMAQGLACASG